MPTHKNSNMNHIVINVNSNNKIKRGSNNQKQKSDKQTPVSSQSTYINDSASYQKPSSGGTLDVDRSVAHGVQKINDQLNLLNDRKAFLESYEANLNGADIGNVQLNSSLGALNQSRIRPDGTSLSPLSLHHDNLESHLLTKQPGVSFFQGNQQASSINSSDEGNRDNVQQER